MGPLIAVIALELVFTASIAGLSSHKISNVLGIHKIAQVNDSAAAPDTSAPSAPADTSSTNTSSQPADNASSVPAGSETNGSESSTSPSSQEPTSTTQTSQDSSTPADTKPLFEQDLNPSPNPQGPEGTAANAPAPSSAEISPAPNPVETIVTQTQAVLSADDLINSPENISSKSIDEAKKEDDTIDQTTNPVEQNKLLINFATDKVKDMSNFTKSDDFASTNFAASRFNDQIDKAIGNLENLPAKDQVKLKKQLVNFCSQADKVLRTIELSVPQESEQDIQIARGQCQELEL